MLIDKAPLRLDRTNVEVMNAIRNGASLDYQRRIPLVDQSSISDTVNNLLNYRPGWNEFVDSLINRIGLTIIRNNSWTNPLAEFKKGLLEFGDTVEETQVGLLRAHAYDADRDYMERTLFGTEVPEVQTNFHRVNRQDFYKVSVAEDILKRAFLSPSGLSDFVTQLAEAPAKSDQWDEFLVTCRLIPEYERNGGFYHVNIPDVSSLKSTDDDAKVALRKMRAMAGNLTFLSTDYNAAHMPTFVKPEDLIVLATPDFISGIDVNALAGAFNIDRAQIAGRFVPIPENMFGVDGCQAIMTTTDFFQIFDQRFDMTSQYNAVPGMVNYFLHHWQVVSASRFVPAVMFTTGADDEVVNVIEPYKTPTKIVDADSGAAVTEITRGTIAALAVDTDTPVSWVVTGGTSEHTYVTRSGVLHCGADEDSAKITVTAVTTFVEADNPRGDSKAVKVDVTVKGEDASDWPAVATVSGIRFKGEPVSDFKAKTLTYGLTASGDWKASDFVVETGGAGADVKVTRKGNAATIVVDPGAGAEPVTYTVTVTPAA